MEGRRILRRRVGHRQERVSPARHRNRGLLQWLPRDGRVFGRQASGRKRRSEGRRHNPGGHCVPDAYGSVQMSRPNRASRLPAICVLALGCAAVWLPSAGAQGTLGNASFQYYGITRVPWSFNEYTFATATASRDDLAATNANWAGVLATWYQPNITANSMLSNFTTPTDDAVTQAIQEFHGKGIKVMLKPHVDVTDAAGSWRGNINPSAPDTWFANYTQFMVHYAQMAESLGVEMRLHRDRAEAGLRRVQSSPLV